MINCRAWNDCSTNVQLDNCTLYDVLIEVLQYPSWSQFISYDVNQRRYVEVIDAVGHLCNIIEPGTQARHSLLLLLAVTSCHCNVSTETTNADMCNYVRRSLRLIEGSSAFLAVTTDWMSNPGQPIFTFSSFRLFCVRIVSLCSRLSFTWSSQSAYHWTRKSFVLCITAVLKMNKWKVNKCITTLSYHKLWRDSSSCQCHYIGNIPIQDLHVIGREKIFRWIK